MFQQAFNKLKQENDDRQKIIRHIRDNPVIENIIHVSDIMDEDRLENYYDSYLKRGIVEEDIPVNITLTSKFDMDYCYTTFELSYSYCYDGYNYTFYTFKDNSTVDMWLQHAEKLSLVMIGEWSLFDCKVDSPFHIYRNGIYNYLKIPNYIYYMFINDVDRLYYNYSEDLYLELCNKYKYYEIGHELLEILIRTKSSCLILELKANYNDELYDEVLEILFEYYRYDRHESLKSVYFIRFDHYIEELEHDYSDDKYDELYYLVTGLMFPYLSYPDFCYNRELLLERLNECRYRNSTLLELRTIFAH